MQHVEHPDHAWGVRASVTEVDPKYLAEVQGEDLGTYATLEEAKAVVAERMHTRFGVVA